MCFRYTSAGFRDRSCTKQYPFTCKMTAAGKHRARCRPSCCLSFTQYAYRLWDKLFERCQAEPQLLRLFAFYRRQIASCGISSSQSSQSSSLSSFLFAHTSTSYCMGPSKSQFSSTICRTFVSVSVEWSYRCLMFLAATTTTAASIQATTTPTKT